MSLLVDWHRKRKCFFPFTRSFNAFSFSLFHSHLSDCPQLSLMHVFTATPATRLCYLRRQMRLYIPDLNARINPIMDAYPKLKRLLTLNEQIDDDTIYGYGELLIQQAKRRLFIMCSLEWLKYENQSDPKSHADPYTAAYTYLIEQKARREQRSTGIEKIATIQAAEYILFPINASKCHWILGVIDARHRQILIYDSVQSKEYRRIAKRLQIYAAVYLSSNDEMAWTDIDVQYVKVNHQGCTLDCGVHVMGYMRSIAHSKHQQIDFAELDIPFLRKLFAYELMTQDLSQVGI